MNWIEIMGPSGIGKSTFLKKLRDYDSTKYNWVLQNEGFDEIILSKKFYGRMDKILQLYIKQNWINSKKNIIRKILLDKKGVFLKGSKEYSYLLDSYLEHFLKKSSTSSEKAYRISVYKEIIEVLCLFDHYQFDKTVVFDEGPINHHPNLIGNLKDAIKKPIGVVLCNLDLENNFQRIKMRERLRGRPSPLHIGLNDLELKNLINDHMVNYQNKKDIIIKLNIPYIEVNLADSSNNEVEKASQFIDTYSRN